MKKHPLVTAAKEWVDIARANEQVITLRLKRISLRQELEAIHTKGKNHRDRQNLISSSLFTDGKIRLANAQGEISRLQAEAEAEAVLSNNPLDLQNVKHAWQDIKEWKNKFKVNLKENKPLVKYFNQFSEQSNTYRELESELVDSIKTRINKSIQKLNSLDYSPETEAHLAMLNQVQSLFRVAIPVTQKRPSGLVRTSSITKPGSVVRLSSTLINSVAKFDKKLAKDLNALRVARRIKNNVTPQTLDLIQLVHGSGLEESHKVKLNSDPALLELNTASRAQQTLDWLKKNAPTEIQFEANSQKRKSFRLSPPVFPSAIPEMSQKPKAEFEKVVTQDQILGVKELPEVTKIKEKHKPIWPETLPEISQKPKAEFEKVVTQDQILSGLKKELPEITDIIDESQTLRFWPSAIPEISQKPKAEFEDEKSVQATQILGGIQGPAKLAEDEQIPSLKRVRFTEPAREVKVAATKTKLKPSKDVLGKIISIGEKLSLFAPKAKQPTIIPIVSKVTNKV